ncbi:MAG: DUF433 domain-containing protein [Acidimicrobiia bacterium]|nr:DUF433 domain-containing protein [Acidimicrobiia bacterium]
MTSPHITVDHQIMGGVPCVAGTRIPVATIVSMVAGGTTIASIVEDFPQLTSESVYAALQYAADAVRERELPLPESA